MEFIDLSRGETHYRGMPITRRTMLAYGSAATGILVLPAAARITQFFPEDFGARGDGRTDDAAAINACDLAASKAGGTAVFRQVYRVRSQLLMSAPWRFERAQIVRDWTGRHNAGLKDASATVRGRGNDSLASFYADPGPYRPRSMLERLSITGSGGIRMSRAARAFYDGNPDAHATTLYMLCDNFHIEGVAFELGGNDWCICFGGDDFTGGPFRIEASPTTTGPHIYEDGFHVLFGRGGRGTGWNIESGDDSIAFANTLNQPISDWLVQTPIVFSHRAFGIKIAARRFGATANFGPITQPLQNIRIERPRWAPPNGRSSRNGYVRFDASGTRPGIIRNCSVTGGDFEGENNGLPVSATSGVPAVSMAGPVEDSIIEARVRHASLWAGLMTAGSNGDGPIRSGFDLDSPDPPNWAGARGVEAVDIRAGRHQWIQGSITAATP